MESVMAAIPFSFSPWLDIRMLSSFLDKLHVFSGSGADVRLTPWWEDTSLAHTCAVVSASLSQGKGVGHIRGLLPSGEGWRVQGQRGLSRHAGPAGVGISLLALGKECQTSSLAPISITQFLIEKEEYEIAMQVHMLMGRVSEPNTPQGRGESQGQKLTGLLRYRGQR